MFLGACVGQAPRINPPERPIPYGHPQGKPLALLTNTPAFECVAVRIRAGLAGKGMKLAPAPADIAADRVVRWSAGDPAWGAAGEAPAWRGWRALTLAVESIEGPGASWNAGSGGLRSAHRRTDIHLAVLDADSARPVWRATVRADAALACGDAALDTLVDGLMARIERVD